MLVAHQLFCRCVSVMHLVQSCRIVYRFLVGLHGSWCIGLKASALSHWLAQSHELSRTTGQCWNSGDNLSRSVFSVNFRAHPAMRHIIDIFTPGRDSITSIFMPRCMTCFLLTSWTRGQISYYRIHRYADCKCTSNGFVRYVMFSSVCMQQFISLGANKCKRVNMAELSMQVSQVQKLMKVN